MLKSIAISLAISVAVAAPLSAQGNSLRAKVPPGQRPPAGMCRIWLDGVPPGQQPAPTDCATAVRNRPANGRVIFGDDYVDSKGKKAKGTDDRDERRTAPREDRVNDERAERADRSDSDDEQRTARRADDRDDQRADDDRRASRRDSTKKKRKP
jgi:hypothetical protein